MQEVKVVARTFEVPLNIPDDVNKMNRDLTVLSGKAAGVCYMPDDYMENGIQNIDKAIARAEQTSKSGHHSVYEHGHITFVIKTNKMMAMILNSLGVYATSEKSARYTKMNPETELELKLYEKWKAKIKKLILAKYPNIDDTMLNDRMLKSLNIENKTEKVIKNGELIINNVRLADEILAKHKESDTLPSSKLAQENARYMISVFTPTTMMYTISFRQAFLTMDYLYKLSINLEHAKDNFSTKLKPYVLELYKEFENVLGEIRLTDNKNQHIRFLEGQHLGEIVKNSKGINEFVPYNDINERLEVKQEVIGDSYTLVYYGTLAMLAQAQRHRTIRYSMLIKNTEGFEYMFYTPEIVRDAHLEGEWLEDMQSVAYCIPQGTMVRITEQGLFEDFVLKCKERMCGRAQIEVMKSTAESIKKFTKSENLSYSNRELLKLITTSHEINGSEPCARCKFKDFKCTEGCIWGAEGSLKRLV